MRPSSLRLTSLIAATVLGLPISTVWGQTPLAGSEQVAHAIRWVPVRTMQGVASDTPAPAAMPTGSHTFEALDTDADGLVQAAEWSLAATGDGVPNPVATGQFSVLDEDLDGVLSLDEFERMSHARFAGATGGHDTGQAPNVVYVPVVIYRVEGG